MQVLYEFTPTHDGFSGVLTPLVIILLWDLALWHERQKGRPIQETTIRLTKIITILFLIVFPSIFFLYHHEYNATIKCMEDETYLTVQGPVEEFHPMPASGHDTEHSVIDGVEFSFSEGDHSNFGYQTTSVNGGVIKGDGQNLEIHYRITYNGSNAILYIAEIE